MSREETGRQKHFVHRATVNCGPETKICYDLTARFFFFTKNEEARNTCTVAVIHVSGIRRNFLKIDPEAKKEKVDTRLEWSFFDKMQAYKRG